MVSGNTHRLGFQASTATDGKCGTCKRVGPAEVLEETTEAVAEAGEDAVEAVGEAAEDVIWLDQMIEKRVTNPGFPRRRESRDAP